MALGTTTTTSSPLSTYFNDMFIENLWANLALKGLTKRGTVPGGSGKSVYWVNIGKPNAVGASLTEGTDPTTRSTRASRVSAVLAEYGNLVLDSNMFLDTSIDGTREQIIKGLAKDAAKLLDDTGLAVALAGTNVVFGGASTHRSNVISASSATVAAVRNAVRLLRISAAPAFPDGAFVGLCHPDVKVIDVIKSLLIDLEPLFLRATGGKLVTVQAA